MAGQWPSPQGRVAGEGEWGTQYILQFQFDLLHWGSTPACIWSSIQCTCYFCSIYSNVNCAYRGMLFFCMIYFTIQAWPFQHNYILREAHIAEQSKVSICVYKAYIYIYIYIYIFIYIKWPIVSLDKTRIHHLVSFIALWRCTETVILTFNHLESIEVHYMDKNPGMFSSKTLISFRLKKEIHKHLGWHRVSKL